MRACHAIKIGGIKESQPVDYVHLNFIIRRLCVGNCLFSWLCFVCIRLIDVNVFLYLFAPLSLGAMILSWLFSAVLAFAVVATNSISGQNRPLLNTTPVLCILLSGGCVQLLVSRIDISRIDMAFFSGSIQLDSLEKYES